MNPQDNQNQQSSLDPTIVALTKAIGNAESKGNYNAPVGGDGETGAYQMTPAFIQANAPKYLKDYNPQTPLAPAQQDELAYNIIKDWGTNGNPNYKHLGKLTPAQIASTWNTGKPDAYLDPEYGKNNAYGSTENYVNEIQKDYEKNLGNSDIQQQQNKKPTGGATISGKYIPEDVWNPSWNASDILGGLSMMGPEIPALATGAIGGIKSIASKVFGGTGLVSSVLKGLGLDEILGLTDKNKQEQVSTQSAQQPVQQPDIMKELQSLESEIPQAHKASSDLANVYSNALSTTVGNRKALQDPQLQLGIQSNSKYGFAPIIDENGAMDFTQAKEKSQNMVSDLSNKVSGILEKEGTVAPIQEAVSHAKQNIREYAPSSDWAEADRHIDSVAQSYNQNYGHSSGNLSLGSFQKMKQEMGHGQKFGILDTSAKKNAYKALSQGARKTIEEHTKNPQLYNAIMKEEQGLINGQKIMDKLNAKKAKLNPNIVKSFMHSAGKYAALYIGDKIGGPIGAILGSMVGEHITRAVDKKFGKTIFETSEMKSALDILHDTEPRVYKRLLMELEKANVNIKPKEITITKAKKEAPKIEKMDALVNKLKGKINPSQSHKAKKSRLQSGLVPRGIVQ